MLTNQSKPIFVFLLVLTLGLPSAFSFSGMGPEKWKGDGPKNHEAFEKQLHEKMTAVFKEIGLSDDQLKQIDAEREANKAKRESLFTQSRNKHKELRAALDAPDTDQVKINALIDEISESMKENMRFHVDSILSIKKILTPEQFARLQEKRKEMFRERRQKKDSQGRHWGKGDEAVPPSSPIAG